MYTQISQIENRNGEVTQTAKTSSRLTLRTSFFDDLWPLILEQNPCDIRSKNTNDFFVPERAFDDLWAHSLLSKKGFKHYKPPTEMGCFSQGANDETVKLFPKDQSSQESLCPPLRMQSSDIVPLCKQLHSLKDQQHRRQQLSHNFVNRNFPWYIQRPVYQINKLDNIGESELTIFTEAFEFDILRSIYAFTCKLIIIDVGAEIPITYMEKWLKFCHYAQIIAIARNHLIARQLLLFGGTFQTVFLEENLENTWQEELVRSLEAGVQNAKDKKLFENCAMPFVFVFSSKKGMRTCDLFKILRKF